MPTASEKFREASAHYKVLSKLLEKIENIQDTLGIQLTPDQITAIRGKVADEKVAGDAARVEAETEFNRGSKVVPLVAQSATKGFRGEHRLLPDELLTDVLSPDAQNVDYARGTIQKRKGFVRLHDEAMLEGGFVFVKNWKPSAPFLLTGDFTIEMHIRFSDALPTATKSLLDTKNGSTGWVLEYNTGSDTVRFQFSDSGGTHQIASANSSVIWEADKTYHVAARRTGTTIDVVVDGTAGTGVACSGETVSNKTRMTSTGAVIDDIRIWNDFRTTAELDATTHRELDDVEAADANLLGYWKLNESTWYTFNDSGPNNYPGYFSSTPPTFVQTLVPNASNDGFAMRLPDINFGGVDTAYHTAYAPVLNTGDTWTIEAWVRYDSDAIDGNERILQLGDADNGNGSPFDIYIDSSKNLTYDFATTADSGTVDTTYDVVVGTAFHLAIVRNDTEILTYINGALVDTETGVTADAGPTTETDHGMKFGHQEASGDSNFGAVTLDEIRLWSTARSATQIADWYQNLYVDVKDTNLLGLWRVDPQDVTRDETGRNDLSYSTTDASLLGWDRGLAYPTSPRPLLLCAPYSQPIESDEVLAGRNPVRRHLFVQHIQTTGYCKTMRRGILSALSLTTPLTR